MSANKALEAVSIELNRRFGDAYTVAHGELDFMRDTYYVRTTTMIGCQQVYSGALLAEIRLGTLDPFTSIGIHPVTENALTENLTAVAKFYEGEARRLREAIKYS